MVDPFDWMAESEGLWYENDGQLGQKKLASCVAKIRTKTKLKRDGLSKCIVRINNYYFFQGQLVSLRYRDGIGSDRQWLFLGQSHF